MRTIPDFHGQMHELTETHSHREPYTVTERGTTWTDGHVTRVPSLLSQLDEGGVCSTGAGGFGGFASRPPARLEALDALADIDLAASRWVRDLGEDDPATTVECVRKLHGLHASAHGCGGAPGRGDDGQVSCCTQHAIEADVRRWWGHARIVTGWDSQAFRPDNTCPLCGRRGGLRVRIEASSAVCIECRESWDESTIGLLADHIRSENGEDDETAADDGQHAEIAP